MYEVNPSMIPAVVNKGGRPKMDAVPTELAPIIQRYFFIYIALLTS
jgi:hypothetical protein